MVPGDDARVLPRGARMVTALLWICVTAGLALASGLSEYYRWQWVAGEMERIES